MHILQISSLRQSYGAAFWARSAASSLVQPGSVCCFVFHWRYSRRRGPGGALNTHPECIMRPGYRGCTIYFREHTVYREELLNPHYQTILLTAERWLVTGTTPDAFKCNAPPSFGKQNRTGSTVSSKFPQRNQEVNIHSQPLFFNLFQVRLLLNGLLKVSIVRQFSLT